MPPQPHDVPADVWIEIVKHITAHQDAHSLSLACKVTRYATLPLLFRTLSLNAVGPDSVTGWDSFLRDFSQRTESFLSDPRLLANVLEIYARSRRAERGRLWSASVDKISIAMDKISMAVSASPRLRKLSLEKCIITPKLHAVIYSKASLQSLELRDAIMLTVLHPRPIIGLTSLSYRGCSQISAQWFRKLLDCCLPTLISLEVDYSGMYPFTRSGIVSQPLALQSLALDFSDPKVIRDLTIMCPDLRTLRIPYLQECTFPDEELPKLELVEGEISIITALIPGRSIHTVNLTYTEDFRGRHHALLSPSDVPLLQAGKASVRHLIITSVLQFELDGIELLADAFRDLLSFSWRTKDFFRGRGNVVYGNMDGYLDAVNNSLSRWSQLQVYQVYLEEHYSEYFSKRYSQCPIAPSGDPSSRGHPSLVEFRFTKNLAWLWFPDRGWTLREVDTSPYFPYS